MSHADANGREPDGGEDIPPPAVIPFPRTEVTGHVDIECALGEYYVTICTGGEEPSELSADDADTYARHITERSTAVRRLNGS